MVTHADRATGVAMILVDRAGQNQVVFDLGANLALDVADIERAAPTIAGAAMIAGQLETPIATTVHAFALARRAGVTTLLNPSPTPPALPDALWAATDILIANEIEGPMLTGLAPDADPRAIGEAAPPARGCSRPAPRRGIARPCPSSRSTPPAPATRFSAVSARSGWRPRI